MNKAQWIAIASTLALFSILYFGFDTKPPKGKQIEQQRALSMEGADPQVLLEEAKKGLSPEVRSEISGLENEAQNKDSSALVDIFKKLSGKWYEVGNHAVAGYYAEQIAEKEKTPESWSIAGTTYLPGIRNSGEENVRKFCMQKAVSCLNKAISLQPDNVQYRVNLAVCYAEMPPEDNPMKGVLMLLQLNKEHPEDVSVLLTLARFGMKTGQWDKVIARLEKVLQIEPGNKSAICMLSEAYKGAGDNEKSGVFLEKCNKL